MGGRAERGLEAIEQVVARVLKRTRTRDATARDGAVLEPPAETHVAHDRDSRYDFDLAEFPLFSFHKRAPELKGREPLVYVDTITGRDGIRVTRTWKAYPGPFGFGGASTQVLLYDLLQLYCEQGGHGSRVQFGTLRSLLLRRGERNPGKRDYDRLRRDFDILRGYDFHCTNAFWDHARGAYVDMKWRLFGSVFYFKPHPADGDGELPFGFIEVSSVLQHVARTRGFFSLGFGRELFYSLKPLEQRLALYLAKKFVSQKLHRRFADDLARALPVEATDPKDARKALKGAARGLLAKGYPLLAEFRFEKSADGRWLAAFHRVRRPARRTSTMVNRRAGNLPPAVTDQVERIVDAVGGDADRAWWTQCVLRLGTGAVDRGLGLLKEAVELGGVRNPGGLLTFFFERFAKEAGIALR